MCCMWKTVKCYTKFVSVVNNNNVSRYIVFSHFNSTSSFSCVCVCVENAESVARLKGRVKAARDKTKDLLKAVNGTMETLNAIPNGMTTQITTAYHV